MAIVKLRKRKLSKNKDYYSYMITIPKSYLEILGWSEGEKLMIEIKTIEGEKGLFIYKVS